ncbi:MAG TPA: ABC transporter permease, partial [Chloroflexota bacterium]|nr:ABC transporter permease [Chloroflexota bacterium]
MRTSFLRRVLSALAAALALTLLVFVLIRLIPGDAITLWIGEEGSMPPQVQETLRRMFGLTDPIWMQYLRWLGDLLRGDLGYSFRSRLPVAPLLLQAVPYTLELAVGATLVSTLVALPLGVLSAVRRNSWSDVLARVLALVGLSMPTFWIGVLLLLVSSAAFHWLPSLTYVGLAQNPWQNVQQMFMPCLTLALPLMGVVMRMTRSSVLEVLGQDYVRTARAKGITERLVLARHALPNAAIPIVTVVGIQLGQLLGGAVIVEQIFSVPGLGTALISSITQRDYPVVQGAILLT